MAVAKKSKFDLAVVDLVRQKRIEQELSQEKIAAYIGATRSYIAHVENPARHQKYNLNHINLLADAFNCSPRDLIPEQAIPVKELKVKPTAKKPTKKKAVKKKSS